MPQENVETFKRFADANNRLDVEAMLEELDADVEWHPAILGSLGGEATLHRGHDPACGVTGERPRNRLFWA
jgi:hypothetical protein